MKKRFTEEQLIGVFKEADAGAKPAELCRKHGISEATYCKLQKKVSDYNFAGSLTPYFAFLSFGMSNDLGISILETTFIA
ncbi:hypothetical protein ACAE110713_01050 [Achromobacter aegrifaciens]|nr:hypothetical protein LMG26852_02777 [Achromobacter aegrifaciens]